MTEALPHELPASGRRFAYFVSVASFGAKGVLAFAVTYLLANSLEPSQFAVWATVFSFGTILGVSELGVGQLILTSFHESRGGRAAKDSLFANALVAMTLLSIAVLVVMAVLIRAAGVLGEVDWPELLVATIVLRLVAVPYGAYLSALGRYHERKLAEATAYAGIGGFILWGVATGASVSALLLGTNVVMTAGTLVLITRAKRMGAPAIALRTVSSAQIKQVLGDSFPYFVSNVSSLATYGGFIALSSLVLVPLEVARLSILHGVLLMHVLQAFDLIFKSVQPRMWEPTMTKSLKALVGVSAAGSVLMAGVAGPWLFMTVFEKYAYSPAELMAYTVFVFLEVYFLMVTSAMQMRSALRSGLQRLSILKAAGFGLVLSVAGLLVEPPNLFWYSMLLALYACAIGYLTWRTIRGDRSAVPTAAS